LAGFFSKQKKVKMPTLAELTEGHSDKAALCRTLEWALRAPVEVLTLASNETAASTAEKDSPTALALSVAEELTVVHEEATKRGMATGTMAQAVEEVGSALLLEYVDAAVDVVDKSAELEEAAVALCRFVQNAQYSAVALGVEDQVKNVVYEGKAKSRKLERLYSECLGLASSDLLAMAAQMGGLGEETANESSTSALELHQVEPLWPLLKIREERAGRMMQEMMQREMKKMMSGDGPFSLNPDAGGKDGAGPEMSKEQMKEYMEMMEMMIDSGQMPEKEINKLKKQFSDSLGMPVDEVLRRKDELKTQLPPEGVEMLDLVERLFDPNKKPKKKPEPEAPPPPEPIDPNMEFTVKKGKARPPEEAPAPAAEGIQIKVRKKEPAPAPPPAPAPAPAPEEQAPSTTSTETVSIKIKKKPKPPTDR